ncbi:beta-lactamase-like protein [Nemania sp. FL0031]|nr:beta-lactamase-like protein [Nemania sp. FL0031]
MATPIDLHIPKSTSTVNVSIIETGTFLKGMPTSMFLEPDIPGHQYLAAPCYSFLIQHPTQNRTLVFDLGIKKDWENWPAPVHEGIIKTLGATPFVPKDVRDVLEEHGIDAKAVESVIWSHSHLDHIGDVSRFEPNTKLIVGPGAKADVFPGYPTNPQAGFLESEVAGREIEELDFNNSAIKIGGFAAVDYFGDGSFYLLNTPGHCVGHMCGFARVTTGPDSFILMGGDSVHHGAELRPHPWHPLPDQILPNPFDPASSAPCPGGVFDKVLPNGRDAPFYRPSQKPHSVHHDVAIAEESIRGLQAMDAHDNVLVVIAHDPSFLNVADFFPKTANAFVEKGWVQKTRWAWLADFAKVVGQDENIPRKLFGDARPISQETS